MLVAARLIPPGIHTASVLHSPHKMASASDHSMISNAALRSATARFVRATVGGARAPQYLRAGSVRRALETQFACNLKSKKDLILRGILCTLHRDRYDFGLNKVARHREPVAAAPDVTDRLSTARDDGDELVYAFGESRATHQAFIALCATASHSERPDTREFECAHCQYRCASSGVLSRHQRFHSAERPFACAECVFRFSRRDGLVSHMRTHSAASSISEQDLELAVARLVRAAVATREKVSARSVRRALETEFSCDFRASARQILVAIQATLENDAGAVSMEIGETPKAKRHKSI